MVRSVAASIPGPPVVTTTSAPRALTRSSRCSSPRTSKKRTLSSARQEACQDHGRDHGNLPAEPRRDGPVGMPDRPHRRRHRGGLQAEVQGIWWQDHRPVRCEGFRGVSQSLGHHIANDSIRDWVFDKMEGKPATFEQSAYDCAIIGDYNIGGDAWSSRILSRKWASASLRNGRVTARSPSSRPLRRPSSTSCIATVP